MNINPAAVAVVTARAQGYTGVPFHAPEPVAPTLGGVPAAAPHGFTTESIKQGDECSFVNALSQTDKTADAVYGVAAVADAGILRGGCGRDANMACVEDSTASLGGRCFVVNEEYILDTQEQRRLATICIFANGTAGTKCVGDGACAYTTVSNVGCGSCIGYYACYNMGNKVTVGENSCIGKGACSEYNTSVTTNFKIGKSSCNDYYACDHRKTSVGDFSCRGEESCHKSFGIVGNLSCNGRFSCYSIKQIPVGNNSW